MTEIAIDGKTSIYGIIGNPLTHSFSPNMQTKAFQHLGLNAVYLPFPVQESELPRLLPAFSLLNIKGFNVTIPYKEKIIPFLDDVDPQAALLGSVNTVVKTTKGWTGFSTDGIGLIRSMDANGISIKGKKVLLIGAGGAAKSIALSLYQQNPSSIIIQNRTRSNAETLAHALSRLGGVVEIEVNPKEEAIEYDLLINTTSVGMDGKSCPVAEETLCKCRYVVDIVYNPPVTPLLSRAKTHGIPQENGIGMLLYQGVEAFEKWTGQKAPISIMLESLNKSLAFD